MKMLRVLINVLGTVIDFQFERTKFLRFRRNQTVALSVKYYLCARSPKNKPSLDERTKSTRYDTLYHVSDVPVVEDSHRKIGSQKHFLRFSAKLRLFM